MPQITSGVTANTVFRRSSSSNLKSIEPVISGYIPVGDRLLEVYGIDYLRFLTNTTVSWQRDMIVRHAYKAEQLAPLAGLVFLEMIRDGNEGITRIESSRPHKSDIDSCLRRFVGDTACEIVKKGVSHSGTDSVIEVTTGLKSFITCDANITIEACISQSFVDSIPKKTKLGVLVYDGIIEKASSLDRFLTRCYESRKNALIYCRAAPADLLSSILENNRRTGVHVCLATIPTSAMSEIEMGEMIHAYGASDLDVDPDSLSADCVTILEHSIHFEMSDRERIDEYVRKLRIDLDSIQDYDARKFAMSRIQKLSARKSQICVGRDVFGDAAPIMKDRIDAALRIFAHMRSNGVVERNGHKLPASSVAVASSCYKSFKNVMISVGGSIELDRSMQGNRRRN